MAELVKPWNDGGSLTATYEGSGDGSAIFSSDTAEGLDRETSVKFVDGSKSIVVERKVTQVGMREIFAPSGQDFVPLDGGTFNVLKPNYTKVEYLEASGTQYINLGVVFKNTDECYAEVAMLTDVTDKFFISPSKWNHLNQNRFALGGVYQNKFDIGYGGMTKGTTLFIPNIQYDENKHSFAYKDKKFTLDGGIAIRDVASVAWNGDTTELLLFYGYNKPTACRIYRYQQKRDGKLIIDLIPVLDENNVACMYDKANSKFLYNSGTGTFVAAFNE